jgi:hypothetical protein
MKFIASLLSVTLVSSTNIHVPVTSDRYGHAIVDVDLGAAIPSRHSMVISLNPYLELPGDNVRISNRNMTLSNTNISFIPFRFVQTPDSTIRGRLPELGIDYESDMVRQYQSLAVIKNTSQPSQLIVGSTAEYFRALCVDGSLARLDQNRPTGVAEIDDYTEELNNGRFFVGSFFYKSALHLSTSLGERVRVRLQESGAIAHGSTSFTNCLYLPENLGLNLRIGSGDDSVQISLFPADYIERDPISDTCSFYLSSTSSNSFEPTDVVFNPLLVSGMNVRTTDSHFLEICDTSL